MRSFEFCSRFPLIMACIYSLYKARKKTVWKIKAKRLEMKLPIYVIMMLKVKKKKERKERRTRKSGSQTPIRSLAKF